MERPASFPPPQRCTKCARTVDRYDYKHERWLKQCSREEKPTPSEPAVTLAALAEAVAGQVRAAKDRFEQGAGRQFPLRVDNVVSLPVYLPRGPRDALEHWRAFAEDIIFTVAEQSGWRFAVRETRWAPNGPRFLLRCAQDDRDGRKPNGKREGKTTSQHTKRIRYPCQSNLSINIDALKGTAHTVLRHEHAHAVFQQKTISTEIKTRIAALYKLGISRAALIYRILRREEATSARQRHISRAQVRFHLRRLTVYGQSDAAGAQPSGENDRDAALRITRTLENLEGQPIDVGDQWEVAVWSVPQLARQLHSSEELLFDGTHGLTQSSWELVVAMAEHAAQAFPVSFMAIRPKPGRTKTSARVIGHQRQDAMRQFFEQVRVAVPSPSIIHSDKDFGEITVAQQVWPDAHLQICLWHAKRAIERRLRAAANASRMPYNASEVAVVLPEVDPAFGPAGAVPPKRSVLVPTADLAPASLPASTPSRPSITLRFGPEVLAVRYGSSKEAPQYPAHIAALMSRLEYDEEGADVEDAYGESTLQAAGLLADDGDGERRPFKQEPASTLPSMSDAHEVLPVGASAQTVRERRKKSGQCPPSSSIANTEQRDALLLLYMKHFSQHQLFPDSDGRPKSAADIYVDAVRETYQFCLTKALPHVWVYLWENWYRPGRWHLWARSTHHEIAVFRTTMGAEAFFRALKHDYLAKRRGSLVNVMEVLSTAYIPQLLIRRKDDANALRRLEFGGVSTEWRKDVKRYVLRVRKAEWKRREEEVKSVGGIEKVPQELRSALRPTLGISSAPPRLPPFDSTNAAIMPGFRPITEERNSHFTDPDAGTCSCPGFLNSRFLLCRHLVLRMTFAVGTTSPLANSDADRLWFDVVTRNRSPPFWTVPAELQCRADAVRAGEVADAEPWNVFKASANREEGGVQDFAVDFGGGYSSGSGSDGSSSEVGHIDSDAANDDDPSERGGAAGCDERGMTGRTEVADEEEMPEQPATFHTAASSFAGDAGAAPFDDSDEAQPGELALLMDEYRQLREKTTKRVLTRLEDGADPRHLREALELERQTRRLLDREDREIGCGGQSSSRSKGKKSRKRTASTLGYF